MGSPVSAVVANLYTELFEELAKSYWRCNCSSPTSAMGGNVSMSKRCSDGLPRLGCGGQPLHGVL